MRPQTITRTGVGQSELVPVDYKQKPFNLSLHVEPAGNTVTVEYTPDNVLAGEAPVWYPVTGMSGVTANTAGNVAFPIFAVRINQTVGAGTAVLKILQSGTA
jgi:hypothetical protein